ncbi:hypothetical protein BH11BAC6_BH11BAC6_05430 [soil metagenome]
MKPNIKAGLVVLIFALSCTKENAEKKTVPAIQNSSNAIKASTTHFIGESYGGGFIVYLDTVTGHGLISAPENQNSGIVWAPDSNYTLVGAKGKAIGTGPKNTQKIISAFGTSGAAYAALICVNYRGGGFSDWYLPSRDELFQASLQKDFLPDHTGGNYWSSSERDSKTTYFVHFHNNLKSNFDKSDTFHVRAMRSF